MYPRLTIIFLAIPALFMALRTTGKKYFFGSSGQGVFNPSDSVFPRILFSYSELRRLYHEHGVRRIFVTNAVFGMIYIFFSSSVV